MEFDSANTKRGRYAVLAVRGELDAFTAPQLRKEIDELIGNGEDQLVIDLQDVEFLDSSALSVLVSALRQVREAGGDLTLACSQPRLLQVFQITNLEEVFTIHDSLEAATLEK